MKIIIINGPNLNLLGKREQDIYGHRSFEEFLADLRKEFPEMDITHYQTNIEGEIINKLQEASGKFHGILLNAGGYTHTSVAIADAVRAIETPVVEVHISNVFAREDYRHISLIAPHAAGSVIGFGLRSYELALQSFRKTSGDRGR
jgi:3-dehydroquinate dehydratase-2